MKTRRVDFEPMRFQKNLVLFFSVVAVRSAFAADRAPSVNPEPLPSVLTAPAKSPAANPESTPAPADPIPRPAAPPSLLPDEIPAAAARRPGPPKPAAPGKPGGSLKPQATAAEFDLRIRYRKARNVAEINDRVRAAWDDSRDAKTDLQKRQTLRRYYDVLFAQMLSVDRGIAPLVEQRHKAENARLTQSRIAPTVESE